MKDFEKFNDDDAGRKKARKQGYTNISSESETPIPDSPFVSSPNLSSFSLNLNEDVAGDSTSSQRPSGVKKANMKRKIDEDYIKMVQSENSQIVEVMKDSNETKKKKTLRLKELKEENKFLFIDVDSVVDPNRREVLRKEQKRIMDKRSQQFPQPQPQQSYAPFTQFFNDFGVFGNDLPLY
ncbi:uncharacterized protein LOC132631550 [Lycium barbarum]|uniref:uncharacterized protein LOC132631550 n=1 Tax=Lycium barbarum TaxID=112863 RepID=UPI00293F1D9F|nr:uncharacterized protein LOC132631550 [Lycium barbarum]